MNYESEIEDKLLENLKNKFQLQNKLITFLYLKFRTYCFHNTYDFKNKILLINMMLDELFISSNVYNNENFHLYYSRENSLSNIIDNLEFELEKTNYMQIYDIEKIKEEIQEYKTQQLKKYRKDYYYDKYEIYFSLQKLNQIFHISNINEVPDIDGFIQDEVRLNKELEYKRYIDFANFNTDNLGSITEKDLEDYLIENLEKIEDGLKYITRQFELNEGRIDILALDKNEKYVIIELKIALDKSLIWQCMYYPDELKKLYKTKKVRMITIAPSYPDYLLNPLKKIKNIEFYRYNISISNHKIKNLKLYKVN